jgi:hypothetical protein
VIAGGIYDRPRKFVDAKNCVWVGNVMCSDGVDKIGYQYEPKDNSFKIKGAYLVQRTKMYSVFAISYISILSIPNLVVTMGYGIGEDMLEFVKYRNILSNSHKVYQIHCVTASRK